MFGEYMIYINEKPILMVCDNTVFVKLLPDIQELMEHADTGYPYDGAKEHYVLDIDNSELTTKVIWKDIGQTEIDFTEEVTAKKFFIKPFVKSFLKKQQELYVSDLRKVLLKI